jgi:hypothetical protein
MVIISLGAVFANLDRDRRACCILAAEALGRHQLIAGCCRDLPRQRSDSMAMVSASDCARAT